ncbi:MAG: hypothetical protein IJC83_02090 [Oscillospiraceae bacterium]|nr:hypothetical protein [Oscillospiraceae bacterium]
MKRKLFLLFAVLVSICVLFSGCGNDDSFSEPTYEDEQTESASGETVESSATEGDETSSEETSSEGEVTSSSESTPSAPISFVSLKTFSDPEIVFETTIPADYTEYKFETGNTYSDTLSPSAYAPEGYASRKIGNNDFYKGFCCYPDVDSDTLEITSALYITYMPADFAEVGYTAEYIEENFPSYENRVEAIVNSVTEKGFEKTAEMSGVAFGMNANVYVFESPIQVQMMLVLDNVSRLEDALGYKYVVYGNKADPVSIETMQNMFYSFSLNV